VGLSAALPFMEEEMTTYTLDVGYQSITVDLADATWSISGKIALAMPGPTDTIEIPEYLLYLTGLGV